MFHHDNATITIELSRATAANLTSSSSMLIGRIGFSNRPGSYYLMDGRSAAAHAWSKENEMTNIEIRSSQIAPTTAMRNFVDRRASNVLGSFAAVQSATLRVHDINGPRGGHDKQCLLTLKGPQLGVLVIEATDASFQKAVSRVMKRASEAVRRTLERQRAGRYTLQPASAAPSRQP